jgi:hypothetical protein
VSIPHSDHCNLICIKLLLFPAGEELSPTFATKSARCGLMHRSKSPVVYLGSLLNNCCSRTIIGKAIRAGIEDVEHVEGLVCAMDSLI